MRITESLTAKHSIRLPQSQLAWLVLLVFSYGNSFLVSANASQKNSIWRTDNEFRDQLSSNMSIRWSNVPLRTALHNLSRTQQVATFLDRRVDPGTLVNQSVSNMPLEQTLRKVATDLRLGLTVVGPVVYIGPREVTPKLATIAEQKRRQVASLPMSTRRRWQQQMPSAWPDLATPQQLLNNVAKDSQIDIRGIEAIPHDLWPKATLPPLTVSQRLTLVLAGFDLTFQIIDDGASVELIHIPERVSISKIYSIPSNAQGFVAQLEQTFPEANVTLRDDHDIEFSGTAEAHRMVEKLLGSGEKRRRVETEDNKRYTFRVTAKPVGAVLRTLARERSLTVDAEIVPRHGLEMLISVEMNQATFEQAIQAVTNRANLGFRISGDRLLVFPASSQ